MKKIIFTSLIIASTLFSANHVIDQKDKTYNPSNMNVKVGDTITFKNSDSFAHNAYTDDEENEFDIGMQTPGEDKQITIKAAGTFSIECAIHPNMLLEITAE